MNENKFLKIFSILAFMVFACISCWATAESLHMLLYPLSIIFCWLIAIGFFFIASWGTKMIVDSLNQKIYMEKRGVRLIGGIVLLLIFWLACSMPTNTHTFFYRTTINDVVTHDIRITMSYLAEIKDDVVTDSKIRDAQSDLSSQVKSKLNMLENEIKQKGNPGNGPEAKRKLQVFARLLGCKEIEPLSAKGNTERDRQLICAAYRSMILDLLKTRLKQIEEELRRPDANRISTATSDYQALQKSQKDIEACKLNLNDAGDIKTLCDKLNAGYVTIGKYKDFVSFKDSVDRVVYTNPNSVTKVSRMVKVGEVWKDYFAGKHAGRDFFLWVIISILVDVAAFLFFDIAFKKRDM